MDALAIIIASVGLTAAAVTWAVVESGWGTDCQKLGKHVSTLGRVYECREIK